MAEKATIPDIKPETIEAQKAPEAFCEPGDLSEPITHIACRIRRELGRPVLLLATDFIDSEFVDYFYKFRHALADAANSNKSGGPDADILIHSPGGDLNSCYVIARLLGRWLKSWEAVVPSYAASGATLICLGSANIVMSQLGQLGPLDPHERFFAGERRSPLEAFRALNELRTMTLDSVDAVVEFLLERKVEPQQALKAASELTLHLVQPIAAKIDPYDLGVFALDRLMATEYCRRIASPQDLTKSTQRKVDPQVLVESYPAHDFVIDLEEAKSLNFAVSEATPALEDLFDEIRCLLEQVHLYVGFVP